MVELLSTDNSNELVFAEFVNLKMHNKLPSAEGSIEFRAVLSPKSGICSRI